jgi:glycosyltransferase involved in cell wall biosynthesis
MIMPFITVIIPTFNEEKRISSCLDSILSQDYPITQMEIFIIDGMSNDNTRKIVNKWSLSYPAIQIIDNYQQIVSQALNIGIAQAKGDYIIRLDAHAIFPTHYFKTLVTKIEQLKADNVGGIIETIPANETGQANAIAIALSHPFGMGNSYFRVGTKNIRQVDTVPFGCFRREIFDKIGLFDIDLIRNQDDEFNGRLIKNGGKIFLIPEIVIGYYARETIKKVAKMFYQYGLFKPLVNKKLGSPATIRQFFPFLFVTGLIIGLVLSFFNKLFLFTYISVLAFYFLLSLYFSFNEMKKHKNLKLIFLLPYTFFVIHVCYGFGYLFGIWHFLIRRKNKLNVISNR